MPRKKPTPPLDRLVDQAEAARILGVSTKTIRRYAAAGLLHVYRNGPRILRYHLDELQNLISEVPNGRAS